MNDRHTLRIPTMVLALVATLVSPTPTLASTPPYRAQPLNRDVHALHDAYYVQQHNTYQHGASFTGWLSSGVRSVEIDVADVGDWELDVNGPYVSHDGAISNWNCSGNPDRLGHCLRDIMSWQDANPSSDPLLVFIDMKTTANIAADWYADEVHMLDQKVRDILGTRMFTADELYRHATGVSYTPGAKSLRQAVSERGWPLLRNLTGRIIIAYTGGRYGTVNQTQGNGIDYILTNMRRLPYGFFCPDVETDTNELVPGGTVDGMTNAISQQVVCSNLQSRDHYQITANTAAAHRQLIHLWGNHVYNNDTFVYNYIAIAHGISAVGRDAGSTDTFGGALPLMGVRRSLPGYFEVRPAGLALNKCMDVSGSGASNGTRIQIWDCNGSAAQQFVYTAEGQLRPRHANTYCTDISGGSAGSNTTVHLWDCDGGSSEKWVIDPNGLMRSHTNQGFCLAVYNSSTANGNRFVTATCGLFNNQRFTLQPVPGWAQTVF